MQPGKMILALASVLYCGGCQSSGPNGSHEYRPIVYLGSGGVEDITGLQIEPTSLSASRFKGEMTRSTGDMTISGMSGTLDISLRRIQLNDGGAIELLADGTEYVVRFSSQPKSQAPTFGVVGVATRRSDMPSNGTANYLGTASIQIVDGTDLYDLVGRTSFLVDFTGQNGSLTIDDLDGTRIDSASQISAINDAVSIVASNITLTGSSFDGSDIILSDSMLLNGPAGMVSSTVAGDFFGPNGSEIGGIILMDDGGASPFALLGTLVGN